MALYASGVTIDPTLSGTLSGPGSPGYNAYNKIKQNYAGAQGQFGADASARGMNAGAATGPGSYAGSRFGTQQGLDVGNLESALGGGLGDTAYNNALKQREFEQNAKLAQQAADLNKPDTLEEALMATHAFGNLLSAYKGYNYGGGGATSGGQTTGSMPAASSYIQGGSPSGYFSNPYSGYWRQ
jgi:hypothetical protein